MGKSESKSVKVAFGISKKAGNAVWRNRLRRLLREVYRLNKEILSDCNRSLWIVFSPNNLNKKVNPKLLFRDVKPDMIDLLKILRDNI